MTALEHMDVIPCWIQKPLHPFSLPKGSLCSRCCHGQVAEAGEPWDKEALCRDSRKTPFPQATR